MRGCEEYTGNKLPLSYNTNARERFPTRAGPNKRARVARWHRALRRLFRIPRSPTPILFPSDLIQPSAGCPRRFDFIVCSHILLGLQPAARTVTPMQEEQGVSQHPPVASVAHPTTSNLDTCRICSAPAEPDQPLFYPCKCSGTIRYIHQDW